MMGKDHVLVGAVGWMVLAVPGLRLAGYEMGTAEAVMGTFVSAGAALLPDIDHPDSTVAHTLGPVTRVLASGVAWGTGGHRHATHSLVFALLMGAGAWGVTEWYGRWALFGVAWFCGTFAVRLLFEERHGALAPTVAGLAAWWMSTNVTGGLWIGVCVATGCVLHLAGDLPTKGPIPVLWPLPWRVSFDLLRTGSGGERALSVVLSVVVVVLFYTAMLGSPGRDQAVSWIQTRAAALAEQPHEGTP